MQCRRPRFAFIDVLYIYIVHLRIIITAKIDHQRYQRSQHQQHHQHCALTPTLHQHRLFARLEHSVR